MRPCAACLQHAEEKDVPRRNLIVDVDALRLM